MKIGVSSYTFAWAVGVPGYPQPERPLGYFEILDRASELGVSVVQYADNLPLDRLELEKLEALAGRACNLGIQVEVGMRGIGVDLVRRYLAIARMFSAPFIRLVLDSDGHKPSIEEVLTALRPLANEFKSAGVMLAIENHDRLPCRALLHLINELGTDWSGFCLDTANSFGAQEGPEVVVNALGPHTLNLHLKDFAITRLPHKMGFLIEGRPVGQGMLDVPWLMAELRRWGCDPNAILEQWTMPGTTLEATVAKEARWAAESVAYLRGTFAGL